MILTATKLYYYQNLRFPLPILILSLSPVILSSAAILEVKVSPALFIASLIISVLYLFHIRIGDEHRDFEHDSLYHKDRPIQRGLISLADLEKVDLFIIFFFLYLLLFFGLTAFVFGLFLLFSSYIAKKEFFIAKKLRSYFFLYNFINLFQPAFLQVLVYILFLGKIPFTSLVVLHFTFTFFGTLIFEFLRKTHPPGSDGKGKDTYSWYLGFERAIFVYLFMALINLFLFFLITTFFSFNQNSLLFLLSVMFLVLVVFALVNLNKKTVLFNKLMQLSFILTYSFLNIVIYALSFL